MEGTIVGHVNHARRFLEFNGNDNLDELTVGDIRGYLATRTTIAPQTYGNELKSLRRFVRDFLDKPELMKSFKLPYIPFRPNKVPTKEQVKQGFYALNNDRQRLAYLLYAVTGLRANELRNLKLEDIDLDNRSITPQHDSITKRAGYTFWNLEVDGLLRDYLKKHERKVNNGGKLFHFSVGRMARQIENVTGVRITPRELRRFFASEMAKLGVADRYVDAFCGRVPKSVLARYYSDYSPETLKTIYDNASLKVLS